MRLVGNLVLAFCAGLVGHYIPFEQLLATGWAHLATHSTGVLFALPFILVTCKILGLRDEDIERVMVSYLAVYAVEGIGTFVGWWSETLVRKV